MYSRNVTELALRRAERKLGIRLRRHPLAFVERSVAHLDALMQDDGTLRRPLTPDERAFIRNERLVCKMDYLYWASRYARIKHFSENRLVPYVPNVAQQIMNDIRAEMEEEGIAVFIQQLKARQLGATTDTEMCIAHRVQFHTHVEAVVASSRPEKSEEMSNKMVLCWQNQPWWLLPRETASRAGSLIEFGELHSAVSIQHGAQLTGIARGRTPNVVHLCLSPHTLIHTENGFLKPISEITKGAHVITHTGEQAAVKAVCKSPRKDELTSEIWLWGNFAPLSCTRDHPVLTTDLWKPACEVESGDYVMVPIRPLRHTITSFTAEQDKNKRTHKNAPSQTYPLSPEWGWLLGLYLAEGTVHHQTNGHITGICFSIGQDEVEEFTARLAAALGESKIKVHRSNSRTRILVVHNAILARWIERNFGHKDAKHVPDWAWDAGGGFCKGLVEGYLDGDGHYVPDSNEVYASSVRVQLPIQMRSLIASLGLGWSAIQYKSAGVYYERNCRAQWTLIVAGETGRNLRAALHRPYHDRVKKGAVHWFRVPDAAYIALQVDRNQDGYSKEFYDLEVDHPDHSFVTAQCAVKNSELCEYENPEELVDASLLRAVHHSPSTFFVMESTALGIGNWWHDTWLVSKEGWPSRTSDFRPIFLPWFVGSDIYPDDVWLKAHPIPLNWQPSEVALAHAQRCREFVQRNDLLRRHLGFNWSLPRRQLWWWEVERNISLKKRQLSKFYMETPADDVEAFQNTNPSVFEPETIELLHKDTHSPLAVFGFRGSPDHFPLAIQPDLRQIDPEAPILPVRAQCSQAYRPVHADLVPLKFQGYSGYNEMGKLFVWELPEEGSEYGLGVDTSEGVGQDRSVIQVIRKATLDGRPPAQVAEFASPRLNSLDLFPFVFIVGQFYSTRRRDGGLARPRMVIECRWNGENVQVELQKHGWPNFHKWTRYHKTKYNLAQERNLGWYSNAWSRPMMMDYFIKALRDQMFMAPSPFLVSELSTLEIDEAGQTIKALHGRHDDRVMACGIVYFSLHILETGGIMQPMSAQRIRSKVAPVYSPPYQQMDNQDVSGADIWTPDERLQVEGDE